ncbi:MAG: DegT/DnrJ/EryC1/StrS family aminotransferase [Syntrophaceae bacterium]|nr:DegT/DnrJ/EryC1/StrS family aminotransferase [Syntrophaceae bacterium]
MNVHNPYGALALLGGQKTISTPFRLYNSIGPEEVTAAAKVVEEGGLSKFLGCWGTNFFGGSKVQEFESAWKSHFGVKHAVSVNSLTSGLITAVGAIGIEPGDEVIVSPWTMCASATAILHWNAIPVFADIDPDTFCSSPASIEANITAYTRAIISVDIGGHPADMDAIMAIARKYGLKVIADTAQAPGALYKGKYAGTMSDIGGFSLNYHKHIHTGEGGVMVTQNDELADRMRLIRNHAEAVVSDMGVTDLSNMIGYNFRLGEIESAIGIEQLKKFSSLVRSRQAAAERLTQGLKDLAGLRLPSVKPDCTHSYYMYFMVIDDSVTGVRRDRIFDALVAEGVPSLSKTFANVHLLPMYQKKIAYGSNGFPWSSDICRRDVSYEKGICPVAEQLHDRSYIGFQMCVHEMSNQEIDQMVYAFHKVWANLDFLR